MTKTTLPRKKTKKAWFAPRQVYLRTGEDSAYVELSTSLQAGVAIGFALLGLWLAGTSYNAISSALDDQSSASIASRLAAAEAELATATEAATEEAARIETLEIELTDARQAISRAQQVDATASLTAELNQTRTQLEDVRHQLSEAKAEEATLQAKIEAQASAGEGLDDQPAEEASSLHAQLENAFGEMETLEKARDEAEAKIAALTAENAAKDESTDRNESMLKAATEEIERLQTELADLTSASNEQKEEHTKAIDRITSLLAEEQSTKKDLQQRADALLADLERRDNDAAGSTKLRVAADAEHHAAAIAAELNEVELLAEIDRLRVQIDADNGEGVEEDENVAVLKQELALAETEIETILKNTLTESKKEENGPLVSQVLATAFPERDSSDEIVELKNELSGAKSDIIKLKSDVRVAKERLAEQTDAQPIAVQNPDNSAKLEQQLASTRSRIQQLNKALADAKLREVAVDLALINVVPAPSPPAPR